MPPGSGILSTPVGRAGPPASGIFCHVQELKHYFKRTWLLWETSAQQALELLPDPKRWNILTGNREFIP